MRHPEVNEFEFAEFEKGKIIKLAKEIMAFIAEEGITTSLWAIEPWHITVRIQTSRDESQISEMMFKVYDKWDQVGAVGNAIDHIARARLLQVRLNEKWFKEGEGNGPVGTKEKRHPEDRTDFTV